MADTLRGTCEGCCDDRLRPPTPTVQSGLDPRVANQPCCILALPRRARLARPCSSGWDFHCHRLQASCLAPSATSSCGGAHHICRVGWRVEGEKRLALRCLRHHRAHRRGVPPGLWFTYPRRIGDLSSESAVAVGGSTTNLWGQPAIRRARALSGGRARQGMDAARLSGLRDLRRSGGGVGDMGPSRCRRSCRPLSRRPRSQSVLESGR